MAKKATVIRQTDPAVGAEILASSIVEVARAGKALLGSRLAKRAILVLIKDQLPTGCGIGLNDIRLVLDAAADLDKACVKPAEKVMR